MHTSEKPHVYLIRIGKDNPGITDGKPKKYIGKHTAGNILYVGSGSAFSDYNIPNECSPEKLKELDVKRRVIETFDTAEEAGEKETELLRLVKNDKRKLDRYINKAFFENGHLSSLPGKTGTHGRRGGEKRNDPEERKAYNRERYLIRKQKQQEYKMSEDYLYQFGKVAAEKKDIEGINLFGSLRFSGDNTATKDGKLSTEAQRSKNVRMSFTDYDPKVGRYVYGELKSTDGFTKVPKNYTGADRLPKLLNKFGAKPIPNSIVVGAKGKWENGKPMKWYKEIDETTD